MKKEPQEEQWEEQPEEAQWEEEAEEQQEEQWEEPEVEQPEEPWVKEEEKKEEEESPYQPGTKQLRPEFWPLPEHSIYTRPRCLFKSCLEPAKTGRTPDGRAAACYSHYETHGVPGAHLTKLWELWQGIKWENAAQKRKRLREEAAAAESSAYQEMTEEEVAAASANLLNPRRGRGRGRGRGR